MKYLFIAIGILLIGGGVYDLVLIDRDSDYVISTYSKYDKNRVRPLSQRVESGASLYPSYNIAGAICLVLGAGAILVGWKS